MQENDDTFVLSLTTYALQQKKDHILAQTTTDVRQTDGLETNSSCKNFLVKQDMFANTRDIRYGVGSYRLTNRN